MIALDSNCDYIGGCGPTSKEVRWLKRDLTRNRGHRCTLAYMHHPRFTGGQYTDQTQVSTLYATLYAGNADVVLAGHDHGYQRYLPLNPSGKVDRKRGIFSWVVGTGGRNHYPKGRRVNLVRSESATFGVLAMRLKPTGWSFRYAAEAGDDFKDAGTGVCH
jgi:hypothetical protein